jgi:hypothetical protein
MTLSVAEIMYRRVAMINELEGMWKETVAA